MLGISTRPDRTIPASMNNAPIPWAFATWDMDEVRITDGLLAPEQFLHVGQQGLTLYFR